ncbi:MAG TPA: NUDIX domain-containing protein [Candidatus Dojkabacteria bacterium]|nr:NUDIX domain-containing protein [Candidatus Dojkabacteria bacterium]
MKNIIYNIHFYQKEILKKISYASNGLRFNQITITDLESEHINYHLKQLIQNGYVKKAGTNYTLTDKGKDFVNLIDDDGKAIEKQPKTSILIHGIRVNPKTKEVEQLMSRRLKHPYFGKIGRLGGKIKFGETILEAAQRELFEETGLKAKNFTLERIYHKIGINDANETVQDVIFYIFFVTDFYGDFIAKNEFQENLWVTKKMFDNNNGEFDFYSDVTVEDRTEPFSPMQTKEVRLRVQGF